MCILFQGSVSGKPFSMTLIITLYVHFASAFRILTSHFLILKYLRSVCILLQFSGFDKPFSRTQIFTFFEVHFITVFHMWQAIFFDPDIYILFTFCFSVLYVTSHFLWPRYLHSLKYILQQCSICDKPFSMTQIFTFCVYVISVFGMW